MDKIDLFAKAISNPNPGSSSSERVPDGVISEFEKTKLWVRLVSLWLFIGMAGILLRAVSFFMMGFSGANPLGFKGTKEIQDAHYYGEAGGNLVLLALCAGPSFLLWQYAYRIAELQKRRDASSLEAVVRSQRILWRCVGLAVALLFLGHYSYLILVPK